jgi:hypothetical protein
MIGVNASILLRAAEGQWWRPKSSAERWICRQELSRQGCSVLAGTSRKGRSIAIEARTNLLFSFEKMALRDAVKPVAGSRAFAQGLYDFLRERGYKWTAHNAVDRDA